MSLKIKNIELKHGLILAPMAGAADRAYRNICRKHGAEMTVSEMVSSKAIQYGDETTKDLATLLPYETNTAVQIFGHDPDIMAQSLDFITSKREGCILPAAIDVNMGCPAKKIVKGGDGAALMKSPELVGRIVRSLRDKTDLPVTVKIRCGWDSESINAPLIARIAEENGADAVTVHGRTWEDQYCPNVRYEVITAVKRAVGIPVIANGSINNSDDALHMLETTGCDGLMLARSTMGNPWVFEEITARLEGKAYVYPDIETRLNEALVQFEEMLVDKGEKTGVLEARRQLSYYIKNVNGAPAVRHKLNSASSKDEIYTIIYDFLKNRK